MSEENRRRRDPDRPDPAAGDADILVQDPDLPPVAVDDDEAGRSTWTPLKIAVWVGIALLGGVSWSMLAIVRGETVNAIWFVFAAVCTY
ncbi:carbon starvation protein A, partial [Arthrobacter citreus]